MLAKYTGEITTIYHSTTDTTTTLFNGRTYYIDINSNGNELECIVDKAYILVYKSIEELNADWETVISGTTKYEEQVIYRLYKDGVSWPEIEKVLKEI